MAGTIGVEDGAKPRTPLVALALSAPNFQCRRGVAELRGRRPVNGHLHLHMGSSSLQLSAAANSLSFVGVLLPFQPRLARGPQSSLGSHCRLGSLRKF
jgi:hypothetical protein